MDNIDKVRIGAVIFTSNNQRIEGYVFVSPGIRLGDELNSAQKRFITIGNCTVTFAESERCYKTDIMFVHKNHVVAAHPVKEVASEAAPVNAFV